MKATLFGIAAMLVMNASAITISQAADYPDKPVTVIVPWPAGGTTDTVSRLLAAELEKQLGGTFIVDNRPGASSAVGAAVVAHAPADGYTLMFTTGSTVVINPLLTADLPYKPDAFVGISSISTGAFAFLGNNDFEAKTLPGFIAYAKANPGSVSYATNGPGTFTALIGGLIESELQIDLKAVPYQGASPAMTALMGGEVNTNIEAVTTAYPNIEAGQYYAIAVAAEQRHPQLPDVPTFAELGYPNVLGNSWQGLYAPAGTPPDVLEKINAAIAKISVEPEYVERLEGLGQEVKPRSVAETSQYIADEIARWSGVVDNMEAAQ